jgi:hypothetical protein
MEGVDVRVRIARKCDEIKELLLEKNAAYGNSALDPLRIFSRASPLEQIKVRLDDKLSRIVRGAETSIKEDTPRDMCGYLILYMVEQDLEEERALEQVRLREAVDRSVLTKEECRADEAARLRPEAIADGGPGHEDPACSDCGGDCGTCPKDTTGGILVPQEVAPQIEELLESKQVAHGKSIPLDSIFSQVAASRGAFVEADAKAEEVLGVTPSATAYEALAYRAAALEQKANPILSAEPVTCTACNFTASMTRRYCPNCNARYQVRTIETGAAPCFKCKREPATNPTNGMCASCARDEYTGCVVCGKEAPAGKKLCAACDPNAETPVTP